MASLSRFVRSIRPQDFQTYLHIRRIAVPDGIDWKAPHNEFATRWLRSLDQLTDDERDRLTADAERISAMTDEAGQAALLALGDHGQELQAIEGAYARAHWLFVHAPDAFRRAEEIRYADENRNALRLWDGFVGPRHRPLRSDAGTDERFRAQLREILKSGRVVLEPLTRMRGEGDRKARPVEQIAIYNQGLPADDLRFDGETVVAFTHRPVIETVIVYEPESGTIEVIGSVKKLRERIARVFADIKLGVPIPGERLPRRHFELTPLLDPGHALATDPADRIARVGLTMLTLASWYDGLTHRFEIPFEEGASSLHAELAAAYGADNPLLSSLRPICARIDIRFQPLADQRRGKKISMVLSTPNRCNVRGKTEQERLLLEKYLRAWGLLRGR